MPLKSANRSALSLPARAGRSLRLPQQIVDERLGVHLLLDVERRRMDDEIAPVLLVLAAPHELRIKVGVARVANRTGLRCSALQHRLVLGRGNVLPLVVVVLEGLDGLGALGFFAMLSACSCRLQRSVLALDHLVELGRHLGLAKSDSIWYTSANSANAQRPMLPEMVHAGHPVGLHRGASSPSRPRAGSL